MEYFMERTGDDMENIRMELEKLICYTMGREVITKEDVEAVGTVHVTNRIFEMVTAIVAGNTRKAMDLYEDLLKLKEPPMRIMFLIAKQFNQLLQVKELAGKGAQKGEIASKVKVPPFVAGKLIAQARAVFAGADPFVCGVLCGIGGSGEDGEVVGSVVGGVVDR